MHHGISGPGARRIYSSCTASLQGAFFISFSIIAQFTEEPGKKANICKESCREFQKPPYWSGFLIRFGGEFSDVFDYLVGFQAPGAHFYGNDRPADHCLDRLDIGSPGASLPILGMTYRVAKNCTFSTNITLSGHMVLSVS